MPRLPDLVRDSQLDASFPHDRPDDTVHTYHERAPRLRRRLTRTEQWTRLRRIGHGGFARVYLEECTRPRTTDKPRFRAVKKINIDKWSAHIDYTRELEAISKFSQPKYEHSFVKSYGWFKTSRHLFIAMEYLELGDLHNYLYHQRQKPLSEHEAQDVIYQILYGLQEMHENEFIHRDLKLNNILIQACPPENPWSVKIADFGISKRIDEGRVITTAVKGTPGYMAPELHGFLKSESPYAADIWAVSEVAFQALTGKSGFGLAGSIAEYVHDVEKFPRGPLQDSRASNITIDFILALMRPIPSDRLTAKQALNHDWFTLTLPASLTSPATTERQPGTTSEAGTLNEGFAPRDTVTLAKTSSTTIPRRPKQFIKTEPHEPYSSLSPRSARGRRTRSSMKERNPSLLDPLHSSPTLTSVDSHPSITSKFKPPTGPEESLQLDGHHVRTNEDSQDTINDPGFLDTNKLVGTSVQKPKKKTKPGFYDLMNDDDTYATVTESAVYIDGVYLPRVSALETGSLSDEGSRERASSIGSVGRPRRVRFRQPPSPSPKPERDTLSRRWLNALDQSRRQHEDKARARARQARRAAEEKDHLSSKPERSVKRQ